jgi:hypothetical protein
MGQLCFCTICREGRFPETENEITTFEQMHCSEQITTKEFFDDQFQMIMLTLEVNKILKKPHMSLTTDPNDKCLIDGQKEKGQNECYLVLSEEERAKGFVRPVRSSYVHVGKPGYKPCMKNLRILTKEDEDYAVFCSMPENTEDTLHKDGRCLSGTFATKEEYDQAMAGNYREKKGCGAITSMGLVLSETYARNPKFYGATYCVGCHVHHPVDEFVWDGTDERVGS